MKKTLKLLSILLLACVFVSVTVIASSAVTGDDLNASSLGANIVNHWKYDYDTTASGDFQFGSGLANVFDCGTKTSGGNTYYSIHNKETPTAPSGNHYPYLTGSTAIDSKYFVVDFDLANVYFDTNITSIGIGYLNSGTTYPLPLYIVGNAERTEFYISMDKTCDANDIRLSSVDGAWNHITYAIAGTKAYVFVDGEYLGCNTLALATTFSRFVFRFSGISTTKYDVKVNVDIDNIAINKYTSGYASTDADSFDVYMQGIINDTVADPANLNTCKDVVYASYASEDDEGSGEGSAPEENVEINFKANLTLHDQFKFNIYVPADTWATVISTKINGVNVSATQTEINEADYYAISHPIKANYAKDEFTLAIEINHNGTPITKEYTFSIPGYIEKVREGEFANVVDALMDATENYINAVYNYAKSESNTVVTTYVPTKTGTTADKFTNVQLNLALTDSIVFQFTASPATDMRFMVPAMKNGKLVYETEAPGVVTSHDVKIPVRFLNDGIIIEAEGKSGTYYIDDYIRATADEDVKLAALTNAIGAYAKAANDYAKFDVSQDDTPVINFSVAGEAIDKIVYNSAAARAAAEALAAAMAEKGQVVDVRLDTTMAATQNAIRISVNSPNNNYDYEITVDGTNLVINTGFASFVSSATDSFITDSIKSAEEDVNFAANFTKSYTTDKIYYSDFGAAGDGITDDFFNMKAAHDFANPTKKYTVCADSGKTYYIHETRVNATGDSPQIITITTNVNWTGARFIIDDSDLSRFDGTERAAKSVFKIVPDRAVRTITDSATLNAVLAAGLNKQTTRIDLGIGEAVMIIPYNTSHKVYRHKGYSDFEGGTMHEVILLDKNGNVDPETSLMFDYGNLNKIEVYYLSDELTLEGGEFTTRASQISTKDGSGNVDKKTILRGFEITRSNVTFKNVEHYVTGEISLNDQKAGKVGVASNGFFYASNATHVTLDGCVVTGRRCYKVGSSTQGTYDISAFRVNKLVLKDCIQSNFWVKVDGNGNINPVTENTDGVQLSMGTSTITGAKMHWGALCSQYCKNMEYIGSTISRFDAHCGLYNGKIIDSTINYIALTGGGEMIIENTRWFAEENNYGSNSLIHLREDYGSTWDGTIKIDGLKAYIFTDGTKANGYSGTKTWVVMHRYTNWYFGYQTCFPSLEINDLDYYDLATREPLPAGFEVRLSNIGLFQDGSTWYNEWQMHQNTTMYANPYRANGTTNGSKDTSSKENLNQVKPPEFIKITGNDGVDSAGGYSFYVQKTYGKGSGVGFFENTKFYYGDGANDYYLGTNHKNTETFTFK